MEMKVAAGQSLSRKSRPWTTPVRVRALQRFSGGLL